MERSRVRRAFYWFPSIHPGNAFRVSSTSPLTLLRYLDITLGMNSIVVKAVPLVHSFASHYNDHGQVDGVLYSGKVVTNDDFQAPIHCGHNHRSYARAEECARRLAKKLLKQDRGRARLIHF